MAPAVAAAPVTVAWPVNGSPLRVLYVGDSITDGGLVTDWHNKFKVTTLAWLETHGPVAPTYRGKGGVRVAYWAVRKMPSGTNLAIIELGTNDSFKVPEPTAAQIAQFGVSYRHLVAAIRAKSASAKILCLSIWHPLERPGSPAAYNAAIKRDCPGAYVPITDLGAVSANIAADKFHPNDAAHLAISARIERAIHIAP